VHERDAAGLAGGARAESREAKPERSLLPYLLRRPATLRMIAYAGRMGGFSGSKVSDPRTVAGDQRLDNVPGRPRVLPLPGHTPGSVGYLFADRGLLFTGDALVTYDGTTGHHGPTIISRAFTHDSREALASLTALAAIDAGLLLPGHGEPFPGTPADAAAQARGGLIVAANLSTTRLMPRVGPRPLVAFGMLAAAGAMVWLAQLGQHTGYAAGVLGPIILIGIGLGLVIAPSINTGTFGVAPQDAGVASATVTVGQQLGASVGTSLLNTIFAAAVTSYTAAHLASARLTGRQALTGQALVHGYGTAFWWTAGIFAVGAVLGASLLRRGPLVQKGAPSQAHDEMPATQTRTLP
jgi:glyoxylase-like metal-dependent hydrolase (beta-lactamase superfamily II)